MAVQEWGLLTVVMGDPSSVAIIRGAVPVGELSFSIIRAEKATKDRILCALELKRKKQTSGVISGSMCSPCLVRK